MQVLIVLAIITISSLFIMPGPAYAGEGYVDCAGYKGCIFLDNGETRVVLGPHCGGRVLEYSLKGRNVLASKESQNGWTADSGRPEIDPWGGRFDIGPAFNVPTHPDLWLGSWKGEITGSRAARMTSPVDSALGVQLIRDFMLDEKTSKLICRQTISNTSNEIKIWGFWGRTLATGGGIAVVPLNPYSRFPKQYILYGRGKIIQFSPENEPNVLVKEGCCLIAGEPSQTMLGFDGYQGWLAYISRDNLLFVKRFPTYPERPYDGVVPITSAIYYDNRYGLCELEPIGPRETMKPGESTSFTEEWYLHAYAFPENASSLNLNDVMELASGRISGKN